MSNTNFRVGDMVYLSFNPDVKMTIVTIMLDIALVVYSSGEFRESEIYPLEVLTLHTNKPTLITA